VDGGAGDASVKLSPADRKTVEAFASRTQSDPSANPITGADLGAGPGAGRTTPMEDEA
jgi:Mn-containing catalase